MADDQGELARAKLHSTFSQAIDVGRRYDDVTSLKALLLRCLNWDYDRMNAENILLTHFSARYPKMPQSEAAPPSGVEIAALAETEGQAEPVAQQALQKSV